MPKRKRRKPAARPPLAPPLTILEEATPPIVRLQMQRRAEEAERQRKLDPRDLANPPHKAKPWDITF